MTKKILFSVFVFILLITMPQAGNSQINEKTVRGKYVGGVFQDSLLTNIKIAKKNRYVLWRFDQAGKTKEKVSGSWQLDGKTLILTPDAEKQIATSAQITKLYLKNGQWYLVSNNQFSFQGTFTQYQRRGLMFKKKNPETDQSFAEKTKGH